MKLQANQWYEQEKVEEGKEWRGWAEVGERAAAFHLYLSLTSPNSCSSGSLTLVSSSSCPPSLTVYDQQLIILVPSEQEDNPLVDWPLLINCPAHPPAVLYFTIYLFSSCPASSLTFSINAWRMLPPRLPQHNVPHSVEDMESVRKEGVSVRRDGNHPNV